MTYNRTKFFDFIRTRISSNNQLTQSQVDGFNILLTEGEKRNFPLEWIAYVLATTWFETAYTMQPIREMGSQSYLKSKKYYPFYGRGFCQLTWKYNYQLMGQWLGIDLVNNPDKALDPNVAVQVIYEGMVRGMFTAKKLSDYMDGVTESDEKEYQEYLKARAIINGKDHDSTIANYALIFEHALQVGQSLAVVGTFATTENDTPPAPEVILGPAPQYDFKNQPDIGALWGVASTALIAIVGMFGSLSQIFQGMILVFILSLLAFLSYRLMFPKQQKLGMLQ